MQAYKKVRDRFLFALLIKRMEPSGRLSLLLGVAGLSIQFVSMMFNGANHFIDSDLLRDVSALLSIISAITMIIICGHIMIGFVLLNQMIRKKQARKQQRANRA